MSITELDNEEKNKLEEQQESNSTSCHTRHGNIRHKDSKMITTSIFPPVFSVIRLYCVFHGAAKTNMLINMSIKSSHLHYNTFS